MQIIKRKGGQRVTLFNASNIHLGLKLVLIA